MSVKRLLCIAGGGIASVRQYCGPLAGWDVCTVPDVQDAARVLEQQDFPVGLLLDCIDERSAPAMDAFLRRHWQVKWIGVLDREALDSPSCRDLVTDHLYDFHTQPADPQRLCATLGHVHGWAMLRPRAARAKPSAALHAITGECAAAVRLRSQIAKVAAVDAPVLIGGESGTGKELTAQAIHASSPRAAGRFVAINCGAIPSGLIQSELFGHERGAFTGAAKEKIGLIESARGGTIFFDEIADLPMELQANLLRFLQERTIYRVGATHSVQVDVRVLAATHVDLKQAVAAGRFREDLYYRLNVLPIHVPPLRERKEDLYMLVNSVFDKYVTDKAPHVRGFSSAAMRAITLHDWPGNIRELINCVRRAMVLAEQPLISPEDLNLAPPTPAGSRIDLDKSRHEAERVALCNSLHLAGKNIARAARAMGVSRMTVYRLIAKHNISV